MNFYSYSKYLLSSFIIVACCLQQCCFGQSTTVRPYKFGFTIDEQQHRREMRDERGIVMGEFGFITADGIYHVTVYATDEQGRFRILAMKNYPYESPPKTVEVMVQPKAAPMTTTAKPLMRHNFNTEACSGCFLRNGKNKPKGSNEIEGKSPKKDITPLSKTLPNPSAGSSAKPNETPSTGKTAVFYEENVLPNFKVDQFDIKQNTTLIESIAFKDLNALKNAVISQQFYTTLSTPAPKKATTSTYTNGQSEDDKKALTNTPEQIESQTFIVAPVKFTIPYTNTPKINNTFACKNLCLTKATAATLAANKVVTRPVIKALQSTTAPHTNTFYKDFTSPSTLASSQVATNSFATNDVDTTTYTSPVNRPLTTAPEVEVEFFTNAPNQINTIPSFNKPKQFFTINARLTSTKDKTNSNTNVKDPTYSVNYQYKSILKTFKTPAQENDNNPQLHNSLHEQRQYPALSPHNNKETNMLAGQSTKNNNLLYMKIKPLNFLNYNLHLAAQENTLSKTPLKNSLERNSNTISTTQNKNTNNLPKQSVKTKDTSLLSNSATANKHFELQNTQTAPDTKLSEKSDTTTKEAFSKDLSQISLKPTTTQGTTANSPTSNTFAGNPPPIMDIIMQEVLPTLMGKKGQTTAAAAAVNPAQSTNLNNKANAVPTPQKPSSNSASFDGSRNSAGSAGPSAVNGKGDGDLYRFKYILDYHGHTETGKRNGNKEGSYFVIGDDNVERTIEYVANELGYQPRIRWRKLNSNEIKPKENTLKDYEFVWFQK